MRWLVVVAWLALACGDDDAGPSDAGARDGGPLDGGVETLDAGADAGGRDAGPPDAGPLDAGPPPDEIVAACAEVVLPGAASEGSPAVDGWPLLFVEARGDDAVFRAPAVARPTRFRVGDTLLEVTPADTSGFDVPGLAFDCAPFLHGVASGDPRPDGVTLWTRIDAGEDTLLSWVLTRDPELADEVASGTVQASAASDYTVHVDVDALDPATTYYFRFSAPDGAVSTLGRTRTAGETERARFAVASCSSLYSGYFNAYRRMAERDDLDLVIHLGDYIYDFVDENERIRVPPSGEVNNPDDLASHRARHAQYLSDPDLRAARAAHPFFVLWDNHDLERGAPDYAGGVQAFREWNPIQPQDEGAESDVLFRVLRYGSLADVFIVDMYLFQDRDLIEGSDAPSALGNAQFDWLRREVEASTASWRVIGMQKVFVDLSPFSGFNDFPEDRSRIIALFREGGIDDNVFLSGDSHFTAWMDVVDDPRNEEMPYDPESGEGAIGVELLASSISRGNFDEQLGMGADRIIAGIRDGFLRSPHVVDAELTSHGYGVIDLQRERMVAEIWYSPILVPSREERFGGAYAMPRGRNRLRSQPHRCPLIKPSESSLLSEPLNEP